MLQMDYWKFLRACLTNPRRVGAVAPSSAALAVQMANAIEPDSKCMTLELGPGTGVVTRALLARGINLERLIALEHSNYLAAALENHIPGLRVFCGDAFAIREVFMDKMDWRIGNTVSSLPLLTIPVSVRKQLYEDIFDLMIPGATLVQFTYRAKPPVPDHKSSFVATPYAYVKRNIPPAWIWTYHRPGNERSSENYGGMPPSENSPKPASSN